MTPDPLPLSLGFVLKRYRFAAGLTQEDLAARAGISVRTLAALEAGSMHTPRRSTLQFLAAALQLSDVETQAFLALKRPVLPPTVVEAPPTNLPAAPTPLIGREQLTEHALQLLRQRTTRLLTLIGTAGVGKTRLALHLAQRSFGDFRDGVYLVELAPLTQARLLPPALATILGVREQGLTPLIPRLFAALRDKHLLLVLDNCEHLIELAPFTADLLTSCPSLTVLATSRSSLHVRAERLLEVPPLELPPSCHRFHCPIWQ